MKEKENLTKRDFVEVAIMLFILISIVSVFVISINSQK